MTDGEVIAYKEFMWNPLNQYKCDICPENKGQYGVRFDHLLPCGQQNCWVTCHARADRRGNNDKQRGV